MEVHTDVISEGEFADMMLDNSSWDLEMESNVYE